jgi:phage protein D
VDSGSYTFKDLEAKYGSFLAPSFTVKVGGAPLDAVKTPVSSLSVDIDAGAGAGGCRFTIESKYDQKRSAWEDDLLGLVEVGKKLEIEMGYVKKKQVFYGFIDDCAVEYTVGAAPRVTVSGIDAKGFLMNSVNIKYMGEKEGKAVVDELLGRCLQKNLATKKTVGALPKYTAKLIQDKQTDYAFLCRLAEMFCVQFFIVNGEIVFDNVIKNTNPVLTLTNGIGLISFSKKLSLRRQIGKVVVTGNGADTKAISGEATSTSLGGGGSEAQKKASGVVGDAEISEYSEFVRSPQECKQLAQAIYDARALDFVSGEGKCIGIPELIPGRYIAIEGLDKGSNDKYYVSKVTHQYSDKDGYLTTFQIKGAKSK